MPRTATSSVAAAAVGSAIRRARLEAGLTQSQIADRMGVNASYVANLEAGRTNPTVGQLNAIASALGAKLEISFEVVERKPSSVPTPSVVG